MNLNNEEEISRIYDYCIGLKLPLITLSDFSTVSNRGFKIYFIYKNDSVIKIRSKLLGMLSHNRMGMRR